MLSSLEVSLNVRRKGSGRIADNSLDHRQTPVIAFMQAKALCGIPEGVHLGYDVHVDLRRKERKRRDEVADLLLFMLRTYPHERYVWRNR